MRYTLGDLFRVIKQHTNGDTFENVGVAYFWLNHHHGGLWSEEYRDLCRLGEVYSPGLSAEHEACKKEDNPNFKREVFWKACGL